MEKKETEGYRGVEGTGVKGSRYRRQALSEVQGVEVA